MKRIFVAVDISDLSRTKSADYINRLKSEFQNLRVGWEKPEKLHSTLKFLGDLDEIQIQNLTDAVNETAKQVEEFEIKLTDTGVFPAKRNARILWLGVQDRAENLIKLNEVLEDECAKRGFVREKRSFKGHLTIARLREPNKSGELIEKHLVETFETEIFAVSAITIYESQLQKSGSIYSIVSKHNLKKKAV